MSGKLVEIKEVELSFELQHPEAEFTFGKAVAGSLTFAHARVRIEDSNGQQADGWGAILLSYPWAFPSANLDDPTRDEAMRELLRHASDAVKKQAAGHPIDHFLQLETELSSLENTVSESHAGGETIPRLATLVAISPLDAAIHDAYGRLYSVSSFDTLGRAYTGWSVSDILGPEFSGIELDSILRSSPVEQLPIYHTVGASDSIRSGEDKPGVEDWIREDGVFAFKVKLKGQDAEWDAARLLDVYRLGYAINGDRTRLFADLNEQAPSLGYVQGLLDTWAESEPGLLRALDAIEQPDQRDMNAAAMDFKSLDHPVTIALDEGLVNLKAIQRAADLGYKGLCLKTCKTQSLTLLSLVLAEKLGLSVTVQDLTNPGIALHQSLGMAARLPNTMPIETNQRQFYPHASAPEKAVWPSIFGVTDGQVDLREIVGSGFGFDPTKIDREIFHN